MTTYRYFALRHIGDRNGEPFGLLRVHGPTCERYAPDDRAWAESPGDHDYLWGHEPGATQITETEATDLIARDKLVNVPADVLAAAWTPRRDSPSE